MEPVNFEDLAAELLRALRGRRSQVAFSRRLRYQSNVAYLWESQRSWPTAAVTLLAAERVGVDVTAAVRSFSGAEPSWLADQPVASRSGVARWLDDMRGDTTILELAHRSGRSRFAVARWLKGQSEPRLPDFLRLIDATTSRLVDFVACFVSAERLPSVRERWRQLEAARRMVWDLPWSPAVLLMLQTEAYRALPAHEPGWIAERIGVAPSVEAECLEVLAATGQVRKRKRRWEVVQEQTIDTRPDRDAGRALKSWWTEVGLQSIRKNAPGLFSFNVFSVSERDLARLEEMQRAYYRSMRAIIASSTPAERVVVANLHLFPIDGRDLG
jgi:hypothetical protein